MGDDALGEAVLGLAVARATARFGERFDAAFAVGSLAHGGFSPLVSDVDVMLVLDPLDPATEGEVAALTHEVRGSGTALADRLSVFWSDWSGVREGVAVAGPPGRLPEVDRLDLLTSGRLLSGRDRRDGAVLPRSDDLVRQAAVFALERFDGPRLTGAADSGALVARGPRELTKTVLFPVRFLYTAATGRLGHNLDAARWFRDRHPHAELVDAAVAWREHGIADETAARHLVAAHLVPLYRLFADRYRATLTGIGAVDLADRMHGFEQHLTP